MQKSFALYRNITLASLCTWQRLPYLHTHKNNPPSTRIFHPPWKEELYPHFSLALTTVCVCAIIRWRSSHFHLLLFHPHRREKWQLMPQPDLLHCFSVWSAVGMDSQMWVTHIQPTIHSKLIWIQTWNWSLTLAEKLFLSPP